MIDQDLRRLLEPLTRNWHWVLLAGGGLLLFAGTHFAAAITMIAMVRNPNLAFYLEMFNIPAGALALLAGFHLLRVARTLARAREIDASRTRALIRNLSLSMTYMGAMFLVEFFIVALTLVTPHLMEP